MARKTSSEGHPQTRDGEGGTSQDIERKQPREGTNKLETAEGGTS